MKKVITLLSVLTLIFALAGCGAGNTCSQSEAETTKATSSNTSESSKAAEETTTEQNNNTAGNGKTLVVYFSATGTTKGVAEQIASYTNADTYEILAAQPYSDDDLNWHDSNSRTTKEQNDKSARPEIGSDKINLDGYDTIFIGFPIWWGEEPRIMDTFVESYDFTGKTVIPFCTSGGTGIGSSGDNLKANANSGEWKEGERLNDADIKSWVDSLDIK